MNVIHDGQSVPDWFTLQSAIFVCEVGHEMRGDWTFAGLDGEEDLHLSIRCWRDATLAAGVKRIVKRLDGNTRQEIA